MFLVRLQEMNTPDHCAELHNAPSPGPAAPLSRNDKRGGCWGNLYLMRYIMRIKYLNFTCTKDTFAGGLNESVRWFDAFQNYETITAFYDGCPECQSFPKEEYFDGDWYDNWEDYVIWEEDRIAARAGIWKIDDTTWEVAGVITRPEYRQRGYSTQLVSYCTSRILEQGKVAILSTSETNDAMIRVAQKVGFILHV